MILNNRKLFMLCKYITNIFDGVAEKRFVVFFLVLRFKILAQPTWNFENFDYILLRTFVIIKFQTKLTYSILLLEYLIKALHTIPIYIQFAINDKKN